MSYGSILVSEDLAGEAIYSDNAFTFVSLTFATHILHKSLCLWVRVKYFMEKLSIVGFPLAGEQWS